MRQSLHRLVLFCLLAIMSIHVQAGDSLQRIIDFKTLKVGMSGNQPPLTMIDKSGAPMGFDVDLAMALAVAMQVKLDIRVMPFGDLMDALEKDEVDMVISGLSITPERTENISFVGPYMMSGKSILTKRSTLGAASNTDAFDKEDVKLLALENSTSATFVRNSAPKATLTEVVSYNQGVQMLMEDKADALVADMPMCILTVLRFPDAGFTTLEQPLTVEPIGIGISKDDLQFQNLVDNYLDAYEKTGLLNKLRKKWFEDSTWVSRLP